MLEWLLGNNHAETLILVLERGIVERYYNIGTNYERFKIGLANLDGAMGESSRYAALSPPKNDEQNTEAVKVTMSSGARDICLVAAGMIGIAAISRILKTLIKTAKALAMCL